jgi:hypothetical protein
MIKLTQLAVLAFTLTPAAAFAAISADGWEIGPNVRGMNYSQGMPLRPSHGANGSVSFDFPRNGGEIDAMTTPIAPLQGARTITLRYRIDAARGVRFTPSELPSEQATISLYFQQRGDNWTGKGRFASYRWYVPARAVMPITPGQYTVTVSLDEVWTNVWGETNSSRREAYSAALRDTASLGIAFGSLTARSHGVYSNGAARFTLLGVDIS